MAIMRSTTRKRTGATITSSAMAWPSSPRTRLPRSTTGAVFLARGVAGGRHVEGEPWDEGLGASGDRHLGDVTGQRGDRHQWVGERAGTGRVDDMVGGRGHSG